MTKSSRVALLSPGLLAVLLASGGCSDGASQVSAENGSGNPGVPQSEEAAPVDADGKTATPTIRHVMNRLERRGGLTTKIADELKAEPPAWDKIQPQTEEYARMAAALGQNDPPRGSKESWAKNCSAYSDSATALDKAAQAKDKAAALAAQGEVLNTCQGCHQDHRRMGRGNRPPGNQPPGVPPKEGPAPPKEG